MSFMHVYMYTRMYECMHVCMFVCTCMYVIIYQLEFSIFTAELIRSIDLKVGKALKIATIFSSDICDLLMSS